MEEPSNRALYASRQPMANQQQLVFKNVSKIVALGTALDAMGSIDTSIRHRNKKLQKSWSVAGRTLSNRSYKFATRYGRLRQTLGKTF
eukprot:8746426-Karenia_brevis.AAC.1